MAGHLSLLVVLLAASAHAAVIGIDFGARFVKVGIIQPGKGIELVLNEATKRKSSTAAGFNNQEERIYGDESYNLIGKIPAKQFILQKLMLGRTIDSPEIRSFAERGFPYIFSADEETGAAVIKYGTNQTFRSEELVAFVLSYCKQIAENHAGSPIKDAVITIPPFFKTEQRAAMLNAATIANLNVLALMHENTAFAFKYGFDNEADFSADVPTNVVFLDMGATSYKVSLASFSSIVGKKNKTTGSMHMRGVAYDETLGGVDFDKIVLDMLAEAFMEKYPTLSDPRTSTRAMGKLRKESEGVKDVLSANLQFKVGIEALHEDRDLFMVMTRVEFEKRAAALWPRLQPPLEALLAQANMTKDDVHRIEVVGGATRIPRVKEVASEFFGKNQLSASLNGDEAAALGATLYAAKLSTSFRLRDFTMVDAYPHPISVKLGADGSAASTDDADDEDGEGKKVGKDKLLFKANTKFPHKKLITMSRTDDILIAISAGTPATENKQPIANFNVSGVAAALKRLTTPLRVPLGKPKVSVTFALTPSGILEVSKAEVALEMQETYDDFEVVPMNETEIVEADAAIAAAKAAKAAEAAANATAASAKDATEAAPAADAAQAPDADADAPAADAPAADADAPVDEPADAPVDEPADEPADDVEAEAANGTASNSTNGTNSTKAVRTKTVKVEKQRKRVHYSTLQVGADALTAVTPLNASHIAAAVAQNRALLEAEELRRLNAEAKNQLESFLLDTRDKLSSDETIDSVSTEEEREAIRDEFMKMEDWLYEEGMDLDTKAYQAKKKELEKQASPIFVRAAELEARPRVVKQALEAVNWTTSILEAWATERPEISEAERTHVRGLCANFTEWLDAAEEKQLQTALTETPSFLSSEVTAKLEPIEREVRRLIKKPKPKPPKVKKNATSTNGTASNRTRSSKAADSANATDTSGEGDDLDDLEPHDEL